MKRFVVAIGGNALGNTPLEQRQIVRETAKHLLPLLLQEGTEVVICHGNGPQVGMLNLAFSEANKVDPKRIPELDFPEAIAMTQGYIGFHLQNAIENELRKAGSKRKVVSLVTQTLVDESDPAFQNPTKPIGAFYSEEDAKKLAKSEGWTVMEDAGRGWRRTIGSPRPKSIIEKDLIDDLLNKGTIVIAGGGGGIPVIEKNGQLVAVPGVIDKDKTAAEIASSIEADMFLILTAVDFVYINYGKPNAKMLTDIDVHELEGYLKNNCFAKGSMEPKVSAVIDFVKKSSKGTAIISALDQLQYFSKKQIGTRVRKL